MRLLLCRLLVVGDGDGYGMDGALAGRREREEEEAGKMGWV